MSLRRKKWEEWKSREVEACPPRERKAYRKLLDSVPMPTPEREMRRDSIRRSVEDVFGKGGPAKKGKGRRRGKG